MRSAQDLYLRRVSRHAPRFYASATSPAIDALRMRRDATPLSFAFAPC